MSLERYDVCVLPPIIAHFKIECPCVAFISPALIRGDPSSMRPLAINISQSWAGNLVTCENYNNLWLNKSFTGFISRKILGKMLSLEAMDFIRKTDVKRLNNKMEKFKNAGLLKCLLPDLTELSPHDTEYVPYKLGCMLLEYLQDVILGGPSEFELFLKKYFTKFANQSISTQNWIDYLCECFPNKKAELPKIVSLTLSSQHISSIVLPDSAWNVKYSKLVEEWFKWDDNVSDLPTTLRCDWDLCDLEKVLFLMYLYISEGGLTERKLQLISDQYKFDNQNAYIRLHWLLLCIKVRWSEKVTAALNFAIQFCSPAYACPIFRNLYKWTEKRQLAIQKFHENKEKMFHETQTILYKLLNPNSNETSL